MGSGPAPRTAPREALWEAAEIPSSFHDIVVTDPIHPRLTVQRNKVAPYPPGSLSLSAWVLVEKLLVGPLQDDHFPNNVQISLLTARLTLLYISSLIPKSSSWQN